MSQRSQSNQRNNLHIKDLEAKGWKELDRERLTVGGYIAGGFKYFQKHDVMLVGDWTADKKDINGKIERAHFQFGQHSEKKAKLEEVRQWYFDHGLAQEEMHVHLWRKSHWEGRGENKVFIKGVTWEQYKYDTIKDCWEDEI